MSLPRFFLENQVLAAETEAVFPLRLEADDAKHARVLRLAAGEHIAVIDADAGLLRMRDRRFCGRAAPRFHCAP